MITWIRYCRAQSDREEELAPLLRQAAAPVLGTLSAEGKAPGWGIAAPLSQNDDWWTHLA